MEGICRLCSKTADLQDSHIVPAFVFRWLKGSSGTGFLRFAKNPNLREQDGLKEYWLCRDCEGLFNPWEKSFAEEAFNPIVESSAKQVPYRSWMLKFAASLSWRILSYVREVHGLDHLSAEENVQAARALERWALFLLDREDHPGPYEQHMLILDEIVAYSGGELPSNINRYLLRTVDFDIISSKKETLVYIKLPHVILAGFIVIHPKKPWKGTKLHVHKGIIGASKTEIPGQLWEYISGKARKLEEWERGISDRQRGKIAASLERNADRIHETGSFKAMNADVQLFGPKAIDKRED